MNLQHLIRTGVLQTNVSIRGLPKAAIRLGGESGGGTAGTQESEYLGWAIDPVVSKTPSTPYSVP